MSLLGRDDACEGRTGTEDSGRNVFEFFLAGLQLTERKSTDSVL